MLFRPSNISNIKVGSGVKTKKKKKKKKNETVKIILAMCVMPLVEGKAKLNKKQNSNQRNFFSIFTFLKWL